MLCQLKGLQSLPRQIDLLKELFQKDRFTLIILDACRYDIFKETCNRYLSGTLIKARSEGSNTFEWMPKIFCLPEFKQTKVFSSHPAINSLGLEICGFKATKFFSKENIIDIWRIGWSNEFNTVLPEEVVKHVIKIGLNKRNLIWFMQPHFPWIHAKQISRKIIEEFPTMRSQGEAIRKKVKKGEISREQVVKNYTSNLHLVLYYVSKLLEKIRDIAGKVVVTSDHGEILGEYDFYGHYPRVYCPELIVVPWLVVQ
jgi:hypothetical protein